MSSVRGNNEDATGTEYEQQRLANMENIKKRLAELAIPTLVPPRQPNKRRKKTHPISAVATEGHNLRPRTHQNNSEIANEQIAHDPNNEGFLCDNEDLEAQAQKKRNGRGITRLDDIFARTPDMPKIKIMLNEYGQPVGEHSRKLASFIGCVVRKTLSLECDDWRLVDAKKKLGVWNNIKEKYDIGDAAFKWFLITAGLKWKEFKAELKQKYFDETLTDEELKARNVVLLARDGLRVNPNDWNYLIDFWRSPESKARTERAKSCRGNVKLLHTTGSESHASARHNLGKKLGRSARRDEVFIKTHTRKNGVPIRQAAQTINELQEAVEECPELKDRTIQQGDAYAVVCGVKEPKGRVRCLGVGPTPQEIGIPGMKSYVPTRIQMAALAQETAESEVAALKRRVQELEEEVEESNARERANAEIISQHGSNSRQHVSPRSEEHVDESHHNADGEVGDYSDNEDYELTNEDNLLVQRQLFVQRQAVAPSAPANNIAITPPSIPANNIASTPPSVPANNITSKHPSAPANNIASIPSDDASTRYAHDALVGKVVTLYALLRDQPVAKGTIVSTNPKTIVGGQPLGKQYCEVIVNVVMKRDAILPRPYDHMESMAGAYMMAIAWPYKRLKVSDNASKASQGSARPS